MGVNCCDPLDLNNKGCIICPHIMQCTGITKKEIKEIFKDIEKEVHKKIKKQGRDKGEKL